MQSKNLSSGKYLLQALLLTVLFFPSAIFSQKLEKANPETVGMSTERLKRIDKVIQPYVEKEQLAGVIALVAREGKIVYHRAFGYDDFAKKTPLKEDAIVRIASQTKAITSAAIMMLYEEGHFLLDDPVSKYIPSFAKTQVIETFSLADTTYTVRPAKRDITIRDLLTHTSGIGYAVIGTEEARALYAKHQIIVGVEDPHADLGKVITRLGTLPVFHEPGTKYLYGLNSDVLGYLVEVVSGKTLADFLYERIFKATEMNDTYFYLPPDKHHRLAKLYTEDKDKKTVKVVDYNGSSLARNGEILENYPKIKGKYYAGGAGLSSTALDYAKFLQMLLNGGRYNGHQLLSPTTVRLFTTNQIADLQEGKRNFSLGFGITTAAQAARHPIPEGTFDWGGAFGTTYWADPVEGVIGVLITQKQPSTWGGELGNKFKAAVYQAIIESNQKFGQ